MLDRDPEAPAEYNVRGQPIRSRYFLAPINTGLAIDGHPSRALLRFHTLRAGPEIGIAYVGNAAVRRDVVTNPSTLVVSRHRSWRKLAGVISRRGSLPGIQLACRMPGPAAPRAWVTENVTRYVEDSAAALARIPEREILRMEREFANAALLSEVNGFAVFQVHAAHGYWLSQLLSRPINRRRDRYAWPALAVLDGIVGRIRRKRPFALLDVRVSLLEGILPRAEELPERMELLGHIADCGFDFVSVSAGHYGVDKNLIYPRREDGVGVYVQSVAELARSRPETMWNVAGNIWDLRAVCANGEKNLTFGIARSLIADPRFVLKATSGQWCSIAPCERCGQCHYYSRGGHHVVCPQSPDLRSEARGLISGPAISTSTP